MRVIFLLVICLSFASCTSVSYQNQSGEKISYRRLWAQEIEGLSFKKDVDGSLEVKLKKSKASTEGLEDIAGTAAAGLIK